METIPVYLEVGKKRVFAGALEWPGWCRSGRDEEGALAALVAYGPRYQGAVGRAAGRLKVPSDGSSFEVVERLQGNATTDFGAPGLAPEADGRPLDRAELRRQVGLLLASWAAFDAAAQAARAAVLRKGPRGGGRELAAIVSHVLEADRAYLRGLGGEFRSAPDAAAMNPAAGLREAILDTLRSRARGEPPARTRRSGTWWSPRYLVRRSAWHALDHAWEIEDRAEPPGHGSD